jgi:hypothetical protein
MDTLDDIVNETLRYCNASMPKHMVHEGKFQPDPAGETSNPLYREKTRRVEVKMVRSSYVEADLVVQLSLKALAPEESAHAREHDAEPAHPCSPATRAWVEVKKAGGFE